MTAGRRDSGTVGPGAAGTGLDWGDAGTELGSGAGVPQVREGTVGAAGTGRGQLGTDRAPSFSPGTGTLRSRSVEPL